MTTRTFHYLFLKYEKPNEILHIHPQLHLKQATVRLVSYIKIETKKFITKIIFNRHGKPIAVRPRGKSFCLSPPPIINIYQKEKAYA